MTKSARTKYKEKEVRDFCAIHPLLAKRKNLINRGF